MIDVAQTSMAAGAACAIAQVTGVNDNMSRLTITIILSCIFSTAGSAII